MTVKQSLRSWRNFGKTLFEIAGYRVNVVRRRMRLAMHRLHGRQIIHLLHIGKTGGTAIKHSLRPYRVTDSTYLQFHPHGVKLAHVPKGDKVIFFLRDPASRFVSGFNSRQRQGKPRYFTPWSPHEENAFTRFSTPNELALALSAADDRRRKHAKEAMHAIQHVNSSYWHWFGSEEYFLSRLEDIFFWGRQEHLEEDFRTFCQRLGLSQQIQLPQDDVAAHRSPPDLDRRLTPRATANLQHWYAADYKFMRLCREHLAQASGRVKSVT